MTAPALSARRLARSKYLFLSMATGVLEVGAVIYAARSGWPLPAVVAIGLAYQLATLFVKPISLAPIHYRWLLAVGVLTGVAVALDSRLMVLALIPTAIGVQGVREEQLAVVSVATLPKRATRIVGFVVAAFFNPWFLIAVAAAALAVAVHRRPLGRSRGGLVPLTVNRFALLMVTHQTHYFTYAYSLLFVFVKMFAPNSLSAALVFGLGWVTYTMSPVIFGRLPTLPVLVAGHVTVACALAVIAVDPGQRVQVVIAWVAGGLGGGTVYCIKKMAHELDHDLDDLDAWENIGHVCGATLALIVVILLPLRNVFIVAGLLAVLVAVIGVAIAHAHKKAAGDRRSERTLP